MRIDGIDILRGFAILLMMFFHLCYDLNHFGIINIDITRAPFWVNFRILIVTIFLLTVGISLALTHKAGINWQKVKKRAITLAFASALVSVATYIIFPHAWVYFGILHSIFVLSLLALPFLNFPIVSLVVAISILIGYNYFNINMHPLFNIARAPLSLPSHTVDLAPVIPWLSSVLIGAAIVRLNLHKPIFTNYIFSQKTPLHNILKFLGRHSLVIYLVHQPIFFGIIWLIKESIW